MNQDRRVLGVLLYRRLLQRLDVYNNTSGNNRLQVLDHESIKVDLMPEAGAHRSGTNDWQAVKPYKCAPISRL